MTNNIFDNLNDDERKAMDEYEDNRAVKEELLNEFISENGAFYKFFEYVSKEENKEKFTICQRGNSQNPSIIIYHNNHIVWKLCKQKNNCRVEVNFDHARYSSDWRAKLKDLKRLLNSKINITPKANKKNEIKFGYVHCTIPTHTQFSDNFVSQTADILIKLIKDSFSTINTTDFFKKEAAITTSNYKMLRIEKRYQHELFHELKELENGIYVYDTEFSQKFPSAEIRDKFKGIINEPDMLGIEFKDGKPQNLRIIEVKSTAKSCVGKSGIAKHLHGMYNYLQIEFFKQRRRKEAFDMFINYQKMGFITNTHFSETDFENLEIKPMLILTDNKYSTDDSNSAVYYYKNKEDTVKGVCENYNCSLYLYKDGNFMPEYHC